MLVKLQIFSLSVVQSGSSDSTLDCGGIHEAPAEGSNLSIREYRKIKISCLLFLSLNVLQCNPVGRMKCWQSKFSAKPQMS